MNPKPAQVLSFLEDEGLSSSVRTKNLDRSNWKIMFNEPWGTNDAKRRCGIYQVLDKETNRYIVRFNSFKAVAILDQKYHGNFWQFVKLVKNFESIEDAKIWFIKNYMFNENIKDLIKEKQNDQLENYREDSAVSQVDFPDYFIRLSCDRDCYDRRLNLCSHKWACTYLFKRHVDWNKFNSFKIFVDPKQKRVVFPVYENNKLIFYTGRSIYENNPLPWLKSEGENIWPIWNLENVNGETCNLFEAIFDAILLSNSVAVLGASTLLGKETLDKIIYKNYFRINIFFDNDTAGRKAKIQTAKMLTEEYKHKNVWIYNYKNIVQKDFNSMKVAGVKFDLKSRLVPWNLKTEMAIKMGVIK